MRALLLGCLCTVGALATASEYDLSEMIEPGLWETTIEEVSADGETSPPAKDRECITPDEIQDFADFVGGDDYGTVTMEEYDQGDDYVRYRMRFASDDPSVDIEGSIAGDMRFENREHYRGTMTFTMRVQDQTFESMSRIDGRRIGDCSDDDYDDED